MRVLDNIPIQWDLDKVKRQLRLDKKGGSLPDVRELVGITESLIRAKAVYEVSYIAQRGKNTVEVNGVTLTSRVLRVNLDKVERVFPFVITIGKALEGEA
ncbi:MAG: vitamin B12 dependent methionine synthase, partial [Deltaproteobacteria bacterium]|nr:vitamin B12 dependent methionine synthase [Deltaproteobacteria bacterium]